jgi:hypothetical protein
MNRKMSSIDSTVCFLCRYFVLLSHATLLWSLFLNKLPSKLFVSKVFFPLTLLIRLFKIRSSLSVSFPC